MAQENEQQILDKMNKRFIDTTTYFFDDIGYIVRNGLKNAFDTAQPFILYLDSKVGGDIIVNAVQNIRYVSLIDIATYGGDKASLPRGITINIKEIFCQYRRANSTEELVPYVVIPFNKRNTCPTQINKNYIDLLYHKLRVGTDITDTKIFKYMVGDIIYIIGFYDKNSSIFNYTSTVVDEVLPEHIIHGPTPKRFIGTSKPKSKPKPSFWTLFWG